MLTAKGALPGSNGSDSRANTTAAGECYSCPFPCLSLMRLLMLVSPHLVV